MKKHKPMKRKYSYQWFTDMVHSHKEGSHHWLGNHLNIHLVPKF